MSKDPEEPQGSVVRLCRADFSERNNRSETSERLVDGVIRGGLVTAAGRTEEAGAGEGVGVSRSQGQQDL